MHQDYRWTFFYGYMKSICDEMMAVEKHKIESYRNCDVVQAPIGYSYWILLMKQPRYCRHHKNHSICIFGPPYLQFYSAGLFLPLKNRYCNFSLSCRGIACDNFSGSFVFFLFFVLFVLFDYFFFVQ